MTTETGAPAGGEAIAADLPADAPESFSSPREAAEYFSSLVDKRKEPAAESADEATAETESASQEDDAAPDEDQAHGEDKEPDPAAEPPIERPKSWTESEEAEWRATPRALQQKIAARELERDTALRRTQNDAAEKLKGLTAKEQQVEQVRQQFEAKIKTASEVLEREQLRDFPDIKTMADVERMASEDPFRKIQWDVHQQKLQAVTWEANQAEQRKAQEHQTEWTKHVQSENALAAEHIPELADKVKGPALMTRAAERLAELGFKPEELNDLASGKSKLSIYDHRLQQLIFSDLKLSDIQKATKVVAAKPVPPVVRPGAARPAGQSVDSERIQALNRKPELTVKEATELYTLQTRSTRRAS
jgi:hypothetical protein